MLESVLVTILTAVSKYKPKATKRKECLFVLFLFCFIGFAFYILLRAWEHRPPWRRQSSRSLRQLVTLQLQSKGREKGRGDVKARAQLFFSILLSPGPQSIG